jgi:hypothetical protein
MATCGWSGPKGTAQKAHAPPSAMSGAQGRPFRRGSAHRWLFSRAVDRYCPAVVTGSLVIGQWTPVPHPRKGDERVWGPKSGLASSRRRQVLPQRGDGPSPTTSAGLAAGGAGQRGPRSPSWPPSRSPGSCIFAGKTAWVSMIHVLWCPEWTRLPFSWQAQVLPQRGHGLRPTIRA